MSVARDLFLLAALAYNGKNYVRAAELFAESLSSADAAEFLTQVDSLDEDGSILSSESSDKATMSDIVALIRGSFESMSESLDSDLDLDEDFDDFGGLDSEDEDPENPGETILPSSLSSISSSIKVKS